MLEQAKQVPRYWFPAKRYGWGWGLPVTWQGWLVYAGYFLAVFILLLVAGPARDPGVFCGGMVVLSGLLISVCWLKGEPPGWRWSK